MKLPKIFRPKKDMEKNIQQLLKEPKHDEKNVENLFDECEKFLEQQKEILNHYTVRELGKLLVKHYDEPYTKEDLEFLSRNLKYEHSQDYMGYYLSLLVNKIITKKDKINLKLNIKLNYMGAHLREGTLIIDGDVNNMVGLNMTGGKMIINGDVGAHLGVDMHDGIIVINGKIDHISDFCYGEIYQNGKIIQYKKKS